ncbi:hypothetical protein OQZ55_03960 [Bacillus subtilis]|uniref:hypothetical protein n=1 Tax=Bacillus TaxID=1386 RepID=UPI000CDDFC3B|nr:MULTISPECIES: hypothetical protein [Bacillus]MCT6514741.1 hypothetical protein [Bacillus subtilis]MCX4075400.1 hypothetical protein [Bacillus subtilis]MEC0395507.1 hypothetical protein [Bacillus subtilis]POX31837.1 hypothetical protein C3465_21115 [Bacillus sp. Ru63]WRS92281.1 hypothetical protein VDS57_13350 [Bacillus subtilis]
MSTRKLVGYHGTFEEHSESILSDGFKPQVRNNHWLGQGTYFYTNKKLAHWWISKNSKTDPLKKKIKSKSVIIKAEIEEDTKKILDLDINEDIDLFFDCFKEYEPYLRRLHLSDNKHVNRCACIDFLAEIFDWTVIKQTFEKDDHKPSYGKVDTIKFDSNVIPIDIHYKETQVCVRDQTCIKSKEIEYPDKEYNYPKKMRFDYKSNLGSDKYEEGC